jgi:hypothetical protein
MGEGKGKLRLLPSTYAVCRLEKDAAAPDWGTRGLFSSITRTEGELSVVCPDTHVPDGVRKQGGWRVLRVEGPLDFSLTGVLASLTAPLAREGISVFALSTYDTDYLLVKKGQLEKAVQALRREGYAINKVRCRGGFETRPYGVRSKRKRLRPEGSSPKSGRPHRS